MTRTHNLVVAKSRSHHIQTPLLGRSKVILERKNQYWLSLGVWHIFEDIGKTGHDFLGPLSSEKFD